MKKAWWILFFAFVCVLFVNPQGFFGDNSSVRPFSVVVMVIGILRVYLFFPEEKYQSEGIPLLRAHFSNNPNCCVLRVPSGILSRNIVTFSGATHNAKKRRRLIRELKAIKGVRRVGIYPCRILIKKNDSTEWDEIVPKVEAFMLRYLDLVDA